MEIFLVYSDKVIQGLSFFVRGFTRKESCKRCNVSLGYFSTTPERIRRVSKPVSRLVHYM
ncbi:TPA: hypothetical protein RXG71_005291 [Escherichia coli]|nr:hypothetical protein [Escherichia coli]